MFIEPIAFYMAGKYAIDTVKGHLDTANTEPEDTGDIDYKHQVDPEAYWVAEKKWNQITKKRKK